MTYYLNFHQQEAFQAPTYLNSNRPTVFPYEPTTDFVLVHWQQTNHTCARHLHQLSEKEYFQIFNQFTVFQDLSLVAHLYLLNIHLPTSSYTSTHAARRHFTLIQSKLEYPLTWNQYILTDKRFRELIFKFQKLKLINFAEFWPNVSTTSEIQLRRRKITDFLKHLPALTHTTVEWIRYQLNNTNGEFDTSNPLLEQFDSFIDSFVHVDFPEEWILIDHFAHIVDPSIPINFHTLNTEKLQSIFSYIEAQQILKKLTHLLAPQIHFDPNFLSFRRPDIRKYVPRFF